MQLALTWTAPPSHGQTIIEYDLEHRLASGGPSVASAHAATSATVVGLQPGTDYQLRMRAVSSPFGDGAWSAWKTVHTHHRPEVVTTPTLFSRSSVALVVQWTAAVDHGAVIERYEVRVGGAGGVVVDNGPSTIYTYSGLAPHTPHTFEVRAMNAYGYADAWSAMLTSTTQKTPPTLSDAPQLASSHRTRESLGFTWQAATPNGEEVVEYRYSIEGGGATWSTAVSVAMNLSVVSVASLTPYTSYRLRVSARNSLGWGVWRYSEWQRTLDYPSSPGSVGLRADYGSFSNVTTIWVEWGEADKRYDYSSYLVYDIKYDGIVSRVGADRCEAAHAHAGAAREQLCEFTTGLA